MIIFLLSFLSWDQGQGREGDSPVGGIPDGEKSGNDHENTRNRFGASCGDRIEHCSPIPPTGIFGGRNRGAEFSRYAVRGGSAFAPISTRTF